MVSDLLPIFTQMLCILIASWGQWDALLADFLYRPIPDESTYAGSQMLQSLSNELANNAPPDADLWESEDSNSFVAQNQPNRLLDGVSFGEKRDSYISRESFLNHLKFCKNGTTQLDKVNTLIAMDSEVTVKRSASENDIQTGSEKHTDTENEEDKNSPEIIEDNKNQVSLRFQPLDYKERKH